MKLYSIFLLLLCAVVMAPAVCAAETPSVSTEAQTLPPPVFVAPGEEHLMHIKVTEEGIQYSVKEDGSVKIEGYRSSALLLVLPSEIDGRVVNEIAVAAFFGYSGLISVQIPDTITVIGKEAFAQCENLTSVTLPDSLTEIPERCFASCKALRTLNLPASLTAIRDRAFLGCVMLDTLKAPASLSAIGYEAFHGCEQLILSCQDNDYVNRYAEENRIPRSFMETANAQWLMLGGAVVLVGVVFLLLRVPMKKLLRTIASRMGV